jgi:hypothetical protein
MTEKYHQQIQFHVSKYGSSQARNFIADWSPQGTMNDRARLLRQGRRFASHNRPRLFDLPLHHAGRAGGFFEPWQRGVRLITGRGRERDEKFEEAA